MHRMALPGTFTALFLVSFFGCGESGGDELPREAVSGVITLDGQPLMDGNIQLVPASAGAQYATTSGGTIREGKFEVPRNEGPTPGKYSVVISSGGGEVYRPAAGEMPGVPPKQIKEKIPAKYNARTVLTAEVKKGGPNAVEFALSSK
jgi:hypothetical protein